MRLQKWFDFSMLVVSHSMCFAPLIRTILSRISTKTVLLDRGKAKIQRALTRFIDEWADNGQTLGYPLYQMAGQMLETNI
jgi:hypothetical protein